VPLFWRFLAILALMLAGVAALLPILPAVPFLLLAAAAAARGWPWLADRLRTHAALGPVIVGWQERGALPRPIKAGAIAGLGLSAVVAWLIPMPRWATVGLTAALAGLAVWLWRRPEA
jgi:uncharacterized membrane protein YbaN (DUF454 family)